MYENIGYLNKSLNLEKEMHEYFEKAYQGYLSSNIENKNEEIAEFLLNVSKEMKNSEKFNDALIYLEKLLKFSEENFGEKSK